MTRRSILVILNNNVRLSRYCSNSVWVLLRRIYKYHQISVDHRKDLKVNFQVHIFNLSVKYLTDEMFLNHKEI